MVAKGTNLPAISVYNRRVVLQAIRDNGPISRSEIAKLTGLTNASMTNIVRRLISDGVVEETGQDPSPRGKPRTLLNLCASAQFAAGVLIDTDRLVYVLTDLAGQIVAQERSEGVHDRDPDSVVDEIARSMWAMVDAAGVDRGSVIGLGVAAPGPLDALRGELISPPYLPRWHAYPLAERLQERLGLLVLVANDANATAMGEHWLTDAREKKNFACIFMGDGIGTGMFLDGHVFAGTSQNAGEIAHMSMDVHGLQCWCGNRGCLEFYASPTAMAAAATDLGVEESPAGYTTLRHRAAKGEPEPVAILGGAAKYLSVAAVNLSALLDLQLIVLAGKGFNGVEEIFVNAAREALAERNRNGTASQATVRMSLVGDVAAAVGAATLVLDHALSPSLAKAQLPTPDYPDTEPAA